MLPWVNWHILIASLLLDLGSCCDYSESTCGARSPGDIVIGVLSPCHAKVETLHKRIQPERFNCTEFDLRSFVRSLAIIHTIDTINDSGFLPGIHLGYVICDTCSDASKAIQSTVHMLSINDTMSIQCDLIERPLVKAIIGARYSEVSIAVARLLGLNMVPQISTTSSAATLDDKIRFPSFLRTIPSDVHQTQALAQLMKHFEWNWVGVVSGDDEYGRVALQSFLKDAQDVHVCAAFHEVLPHYLGHSDSEQRIQEVAEQIQSSKAQVVLLILKQELVEKLFEVMIRKGISRTWIASDSWSMSRRLATMKGINMIGDIFGLRFISGQNPGFKQFLKNLTPGPGAVNRFIEEYKDLRFGCSPEVQKHRDCLNSKPAAQCPLPDSLKLKSEFACKLPDPQKANDDFLTHAVDLSMAYSEKVAAWSIAHALRALLKCNHSICSGERHLPPWKLLQELKKINFTLDKRQFFFDEYGNFASGYDLINWVRRRDGRYFEVIGEYNVMKSVVAINATSIEWGTPNKTIPESKCSESCPPGTSKKISMIYCCYNCSECEEGTYTNVSNLQNCLICPNGTWSLRGWSECQPRTETYFRWNEPFAISLLVVTGIGFMLLLCVLIIFLYGRQSVVFKVAGGKLCYVMMAGLVVSFGAVVLFVGRPNDHICRFRQTMYGLGFTLTVSCVLVKAFRTFLAFLMDRNQQHMLNKFYKPPAIIICGTAIQGLICLFWLIFDSPKLEERIKRQTMDIELQCNEGSNWGFGIMLSYIALLAAICFILALKGRKVPQRFNETGYIIFSMIIYLFVWICFIPIYVTKIQQRSVVQASAIVVCNFGIIFCHFLPKCYMLLCKKKKDLSRQAYLNSVRIFSITSMNKVLPDISFDSGEGSLDTVISSHNSVMTINSADSGAVTLDFPTAADSALQKVNKSSNTGIFPSPQIRQRARTKSL
ncbi:G-protein coupled receptor family C group 6 member A-like [Centroberyx affinis]|uniref:G-protein coupled receptor family C group 6 member A-like n=1 Tax=Centroberyx affinis TaxID=166261 RepID=UPI003A5C4CB4